MRDFGRRGGDRGGDRGGFRGGGSRGFGGGRPRFSREEDTREKPVKEGDEYEVQITETGSKGDGITRINNFVIFVPGTQKGDNVKIKIKEVRGRHAVAEVVSGGSAPASEGEGEEETEGATPAEGGESEASVEETEETESTEDDEGGVAA
ncbi:MAG: TRAM domain-containing protein [Candidatus Aenigmarchaeota archaeon]|nr:TRAM domain-containing protein [Candidatus Aenigmarchaeota archaeon]